MSAIEDLVAFLRASLDEDERVARESSDWPWEATISSSGEQGDVQGVTSAYEDYCCSAEDATHIARWDPARVLADVEAKRRILDRCEYELQSFVGSSAQVALAHLAVKQFAQPYAGRPGWREEWRA